ncbi:MAG: type II toxin-antitoxin system prevent-host-death family antitoxin [Nitrospira sp.]|nr:type II toxin-antitoxin system prevent-host-death family antitoxin [Nitrospira sp.]MDE0405768.1 type II toxin-antitoxin system prevent-host-death family antitoxin [Nitrospira sp.]MDE0486762.1 type II toxin-antitoxin system prevent-host-death family antitoxin [Nitrospira sp.]
MGTIDDQSHVVLHYHTVFHKDGHLNGHYRQTVTERYSITQARQNLSRLVRETERGKAVALTRRGEPVAMLIGRRRFEQLASNHSGFTEAVSFP